MDSDINLDKLMSGKLRPPGRPKGSRTRRRRSRRTRRVSRRRSRSRRRSSRRRRSKRVSKKVSKGRKRSKKSVSRRRSKRGNPQAAAAMRIMRSEGISLKAAWAKVKGGNQGKYRVTKKSINKHFNKKRKSSPKKYAGPKMKLEFGAQIIPGF